MRTFLVTGLLAAATAASALASEAKGPRLWCTIELRVREAIVDQKEAQAQRLAHLSLEDCVARAKARLGESFSVVACYGRGDECREETRVSDRVVVTHVGPETRFSATLDRR